MVSNLRVTRRGPSTSAVQPTGEDLERPPPCNSQWLGHVSDFWRIARRCLCVFSRLFVQCRPCWEFRVGVDGRVCANNQRSQKFILSMRRGERRAQELIGAERPGKPQRYNEQTRVDDG